MGSRIDIDDNLVIERYNELKNLKKVAESFGVSLRPIKRILKKNNLELTNRRFNVNHSYFRVIDSEEKAYWLGFLFADGCIRKNKTGSQVVLKLSTKDENHLINFKNGLESEHNISYHRSKTKTKKGEDSFSNNCVIRINSNEMVTDLIRQGCSPRKTFTIDKPNIDEKYYKHFIRGFYDGDGNFFYNEDTKVSVVTIVCASKNFRNFIIEIMSKIPNIGNIHEDNSKYTIKITNIIGIIEFLSYIYDDSKIELTRKKEYYEKYRKYRRSIESSYYGKLRGSYVKTS
jgi:intein-encoded DNA endonuclease-like protein